MENNHSYLIIEGESHVSAFNLKLASVAVGLCCASQVLEFGGIKCCTMTEIQITLVEISILLLTDCKSKMM